MKVQLNQGTRIQFGDGSLSEYGAVVDVPEELGVALTSGVTPAGVEVKEGGGEKPALRKKEK